MNQDKPCLAYRVIKTQMTTPMVEALGWTSVVRNDDVRSAVIDIRHFPVDGELITVGIFGDEINVKHELLTELNRAIPIPVNFNNVKIAMMLEMLWHFSAEMAIERLGPAADPA